MKTLSVHIVRHYGLVGGMENYVVELTQALNNNGQSVIILCEKKTLPIINTQIKIIELGDHIKKPRWLAQWCFSMKVAGYLKSNKMPGAIIHSHERSSNHQVTTFHGPPFLNRKKRFLDFLSPRILMWTWLEQRELLGSQVSSILPNSPLIAEQLKHHYPSINHKIGKPAYPGVAASYSRLKKTDHPLTIGFIGREWKRKGLALACIIIKALQVRFPELHFLVVGCNPNEVTHLFEDLPKHSYTLAGWTDNTAEFIPQIDLLLHPAKAEPFGMVIAEANAARIPVVVSEHCGIASLITNKQGAVCQLDEKIIDVEPWVTACSKLLTQAITIEPLGLSWEALALQHIELYESLNLETQRANQVSKF